MSGRRLHQVRVHKVYFRASGSSDLKHLLTCLLLLGIHYTSAMLCFIAIVDCTQ